MVNENGWHIGETPPEPDKESLYGTQYLVVDDKHNITPGAPMGFAVWRYEKREDDGSVVSRWVDQRGMYQGNPPAWKELPSAVGILGQNGVHQKTNRFCTRLDTGLRGYSTRSLCDELEIRDGVEGVDVLPHKTKTVVASGPATIFVVM